MCLSTSSLNSFVLEMELFIVDFWLLYYFFFFQYIYFISGLVFLQYRNETKRALLPNEITSIDTVKALFVRSFPKQLTMEYLDSPNVKIYIHDSSKDMFYELEDLRWAFFSNLFLNKIKSQNRYHKKWFDQNKINVCN